MRFAALGFTLGVWLLQHRPELPGAGWLALYFAFAAIAGVGFSRRVSPIVAAGGAFIGFAALGFAWAAVLAELRLSDRLDTALEGLDLPVSGVVAGLPQAFERGVRFDFDVESPETGVPRRIVLSSYGGFAPDDSQGVLPVRAGERWRFTVRLRRPHGGAARLSRSHCPRRKPRHSPVFSPRSAIASFPDLRSPRSARCTWSAWSQPRSGSDGRRAPRGCSPRRSSSFSRSTPGPCFRRASGRRSPRPR